MRPLRLVMQAFGPYRGQESVDFSELGANRVFLIHGDTGAGKTTILDAMVFALYGDTSGGERRADQMRCDSAPPAVPTEVVFDFALGERSFRIRRRPAQQVSSARGGGSLVTKPAEVVLWERTGCAPDEEGRPLATKIREVDAAVRGLLGFSCEQFRQVVVLPQGRFRELLSSGSDKREEILRHLFRTERFRELEVRLAESAKQVRKDMDLLELRRRAQLDLAGAEDDRELAVLMEAAGDAVTVASDGVEAAGLTARLFETELQSARQVAEAFAALSQARARVDEVLGRREAVDVSRRLVAAALRAEEVRPIAVALAQAGARSEQALSDRGAAENALGAAKEREAEAAVRLAVENERQPERSRAEDAVRELQRQAGALGAWREAATDKQTESERLAAAKEASTAATTRREGAQVVVAQLRALVEAGERAGMRLETSGERLRQARQTEEQCRRLALMRAQREAAAAEHSTLRERDSASLVALREAEERARAVDERWRTGRAAALAATLQAGQACPVCGSMDHPSPAGDGGSGVTDEDLDRVQQALVMARDEHGQAREIAATARDRLTSLQAGERALEQEVGEGGRQTLEQACAEVESWEAEVEALQAEVDRADVAERLAAAVEREAEARRASEEAAAATTSCAQRLARAEERLSERSRGLPEALTAEGALEEALTEAQNRAEVLRLALSAAVDEAGMAAQERISRQASVEAATAAAAAAANQVAAAEGALYAALTARAFVDEHEWRQHLMDEEQRLELERRIATFQDDLQLARGRLQQAEAAVEGRCPADDIEQLQTSADEARERLDGAMSAHARAKAALGQLLEVRANLDELDRESNDIRAAYGVVGALAEVAGGQNASRVSFQRWVLGVYLDEVLAVAGRRLYAMSKGRYRLEREREAQSRRRPSGLDIAVFDEFSGAARPAVTLSGGESFLAALALALGLAETVQEYAAGTPLETIFVDEGFGALDPDALELAVDALMDLQMSGRLVGVISHVAELRQVIPARLEVRGGATGSSARFIVP